MAEFWLSDYHIDGFRIDDFVDINNWDFVQEFHDRATAKAKRFSPANRSSSSRKTRIAGL